jgi:hypothetical protein
MRLPVAVSVTFALLLPALACEPPPQSLIGSWEVTGVDVDAGPVSALVTDDPTYMGAVLAIGADSLIWTEGTDLRPVNPAIDNCDAAPGFEATGKSFIVSCGEEPWGPGNGAELFQTAGDELSLVWYDGGTLTLTRIP